MRKLLGKKDIETALHVNATISTRMQQALELWEKMYCNDSPWLHEPTAANPEKIVSLGLASFLSSEKARMATLEMKSVITDSKSEETTEDNLKTRAGYLNHSYKKLLSVIRRELEPGIALGGLVIKPYIYKETEIEFEFIKATDFYPISFDSTKKVTEAAFVDRVVINNMIYTRLEYHKLNDNNSVTVINKAFKTVMNDRISDNRDFLGTEIPLASVPCWADLSPEITIQDVDRLLFSYFRMPEANSVDPGSPLGVSAYSRATSLIREADLQYSRLLWEYEGGQLAIDVDATALMVEVDSKGNRIEVPTMLQRRLFRKIDLTSDETFNVFNPNLRDTGYINGLNSLFMRIEDVCGISRGVISDVTRSEAKTATEMLILKQRSFAANADIQHALQIALDDVIYIMNALCDLYSLAPAGEYFVSYEWDDSLITSPDEELARRLMLKKEGLESRVDIRMWYYGETKEQAEKKLKEIDDEKKRDAELMALSTGLIGSQEEAPTKDGGIFPKGGKENTSEVKND